MDIDVFEQRLDALDKDALVTFVIRRQHQFTPEEKDAVQRVVASKLPPDVWKNHVDKLRRDGVDLTPLNRPKPAETKTTGSSSTMIWILMITLIVGLGALVYTSLIR